jgi:hypothetical protein
MPFKKKKRLENDKAVKKINVKGHAKLGEPT